MKNINHIVLIDDSKIDCFINQKIITHAFENATIKVFNNSFKALENFRKNPKKQETFQLFSTNLILLDINMPIMNGFEFLKELAKLDAFIEKPIDVYFLSSSNNENDISNAREIEYCSGYITKPLTKDKLNEAMELKNKRELDFIHNIMHNNITKR